MHGELRPRPGESWSVRGTQLRRSRRVVVVCLRLRPWLVPFFFSAILE